MGLSSFASKSIEDVCAVNSSVFFQMYWSGDRDTMVQRLERAKAAGAVGIIVTLDGDGQNDPADIPKLLEMLRSDPGLGMVSGVRVKRKDTASRRLASRIGNGFRNAMLGDGASDTGCGLKAFHRQMYLNLPYFDHIHRFTIALMLREEHGYSPLVICPKTLVNMWQEYLDAYEVFGKVVICP